MMRSFEPQQIVVASDFSDAAADALRTGTLVADAFGANLSVIYADDFFPLPVEANVDRALLRAEAESRLQRWVATHAPSHDIAVDVVSGHPVAALLAAAERQQADLLVLGTHPRHGFDRFYLGSFAEAVLRGAKMPVLTARRGMRAIRSIVCGVDCTNDSLAAVQSAVTWGEVFHAQVTVVSVIEPNHPRGHLVGELEAWMPADLRARCQYKELVIRGGVSERLVAFAGALKADLIIVGGAKGTSDFTDVAERVVRRARCAVLTMAGQPVPVYAGAERRELAVV